MANRKESDARRFDFCVRCLQPAGSERLLIEHHLFGRKNNRTSVAFICAPCNAHAENLDGPVQKESELMSKKVGLLLSSRALRWVIRNWKHIANGFESKNRNGVSCSLQPGSGGWVPPFGAVGNSGRRYYFIPPDELDDSAETPTTPAAGDDGLGGPACGAAWVRFKGRAGNILNRFLDLHREHHPPGVDIEALRQD